MELVYPFYVSIVLGHETGSQQVVVNGTRVSVIYDILTVNTWTIHKATMFVCLSHGDKITQARSELVEASVNVHPLPMHLHDIIKLIENHYRTS
jgi:hypothetical protein